MAVEMAASFQGSSSWLPLAQGQTALLGGGAHSSGPSSSSPSEVSSLGLGHTQSGQPYRLAMCDPGLSDLMTAFRIPGPLQCAVRTGVILDFEGAVPRPGWQSSCNVGGWLSALPCMCF
jgi:hypothetical protein